MSHARDNISWLKRGKQRAAVAQAMRKPMTGSEICTAARKWAPKIKLRDVWHLLREMENRRLAKCLNPRLITGRLHTLTEEGRIAVREAFRTVVAAPASGVDWRKYSWVARAKARRLTLTTLHQLEEKVAIPHTVKAISKRLPPENAMGFDRTNRAVKELVRLGLVQPAGKDIEHGWKLYRVTPAGKRILEQLQR